MTTQNPRWRKSLRSKRRCYWGRIQTNSERKPEHSKGSSKFARKLCFLLMSEGWVFFLPQFHSGSLVSGLFPCSSLPMSDKDAIMNFQPTEVSVKLEGKPRHTTPLIGGQGCSKTAVCLETPWFSQILTRTEDAHPPLTTAKKQTTSPALVYRKAFCHFTAIREMQVVWKSLVCFSSKTKYFQILTSKKCSLCKFVGEGVCLSIE